MQHLLRATTKRVSSSLVSDRKNLEWSRRVRIIISVEEDMMTVWCADATRLRERGKSDTVLLKIVTSADGETFVLRKCEEFVWLCEQLSLSFPGVVLPTPPCADGVAFPSQRSGAVGAYLERARQAADRFAKRLAVHDELVGAECVVAFLYAPDQVFARAKPRLEAEAKDGSPLKRVEVGPGLSWLEKITQTLSGDGKRTARLSAVRCQEIDAALEDLMVMRTTTSCDGEAVREQSLALSESSAAQRTLEDASAREAEREDRCEQAGKRALALGTLLERRGEALAKVGAAAKALARADADERAADVLHRLGTRMLDQEQNVEDEALSAKGPLFEAVDEARLAARACRAALRHRAAVRAAVGDANGRAARAKTKHARSEAALALARDKRRVALEQSRADAVDARRVSDAFASARPVVEAAVPAAPAENAARAIKVDSRYAESPLTLALRAGSSDSNSRLGDTTTCAGVNVPDVVVQHCAPARLTETLTCGYAGQPQSEQARINDYELQLAFAERQARAARREATAAADDQAHAEVALLDATRRLARDLRTAHAYRAVDLARSLLEVVKLSAQRAAADRQAWQAISLALTAPEQRPHPQTPPAFSHDDQPIFDTPKALAPTDRHLTPTDADTSWYDLVPNTRAVK